jgi:hypothetical protein
MARELSPISLRHARENEVVLLASFVCGVLAACGLVPRLGGAATGTLLFLGAAFRIYLCETRLNLPQEPGPARTTAEALRERLSRQMTGVILIAVAGIATTYEMLLFSERASPTLGRVLHSVVLIGLLVALGLILWSPAHDALTLSRALYQNIRRRASRAGRPAA